MAKRVKARTPSATAEPEIVYVFGPSSTGKSSFGERLIEKLAILGLDGVHVLCDGYTTPRCLRLKEGLNGYDPRTYDQKQLATDLHDLIRRGVRVRIPVYDQATGESQGKVVVRPAPVIVVDGTAGAFEGTWEKYPGLIIAFTATAEVQLDLRVRVAVASRGYTPEAARAECRDNPALFARYLGDRVRFAHLLVRTHADWRYEVERVPDGFDLKV
jgi:uridine kinase